MLTAYEKLKQTLLQKQYTWLVTGVAGFIGSNLLETLLSLNQKVIGLDNFATGSKKNLETVLGLFPTQQFHFHEGDIRSLDDCRNAVKNVDFVLHQAALGSVPRSIKTPEITNATNVDGFLNMLIAAKDANVKRFVFASSSSVYGDSAELPKKEEKIGNPLSPYAVSKYTNELYAKAFATCYGLETIGLRYFNVFGPRQDPNGPYAAVIPRWVHAISQNETVAIFGDGETSRDFCYVANAVQANLLAAMTQNSEAINQIYNIAVSEQHTLNQLFNMIAETLGASHAKCAHQDFRAGDIRHSLAEVKKAKELLGYQATHTLRAGLETMLKQVAMAN